MGVRNAGAMVEAQKLEKLKIKMVDCASGRSYVYTVCTATSISRHGQMFGASDGWGGRLRIFDDGRRCQEHETVQTVSHELAGEIKPDGVGGAGIAMASCARSSRGSTSCVVIVAPLTVPARLAFLAVCRAVADFPSLFKLLDDAREHDEGPDSDGVYRLDVMKCMCGC
jgi:hypothetical protein